MGRPREAAVESGVEAGRRGLCRTGAPTDRDGIARERGISDGEDQQGGFSGVVSVRRYARNWVTYIAHGGLILALLLSSSALREGQRGTDNQSDAEDSSSKQSLPLPPILESSYSSLIDQRACQPAQNDHQTELCIAWRAAKATEDQAFWAAVACWVGVAGIVFVVRTLHYTHLAAVAAQASAKAAELAVEESAKTLAHAQYIAERDLRPWLTIEAFLDSPISVSKTSQMEGEGDRFELYTRFYIHNVGKSVARNVIYHLSAADLGEVINPDQWFDSTIERAVLLSRLSLEKPFGRGFDMSYNNDSLAPSEKHENRRWCYFAGTAPANQPVWRGYQFCVCVVAAYMGASNNEIFYTAKVFPIGFPEVPTFQRFIGPDRLPIGTGDVAFGPVRKARAT